MMPEDLVERLRAAKKPDNALDIAIDIALFEPDEKYVSVAANSAGTKIVYHTSEGRTETYWAADHTLNEQTRANAIALLTAMQAERDAA